MKQFMLELDALEKAIAVERDNQLRKMRQRKSFSVSESKLWTRTKSRGKI